MKVLYTEENITLTDSDGTLRLQIGEKPYTIASHPYEPCTYLLDGDHICTVVHNAFNAREIRRLAENGGDVISVTGNPYDIGRICRLLAFAAAHCPDCDIGYAEGKIAVEQLKALGAVSPETAVAPATVGVRQFSSALSHSRRLKERVMITKDGKAYVRIR